MKLDSSVSAIVTGGASGLGEATARAIARSGARVALFDLNEDLGEKLAGELGGVFCKVDVSDLASVEAGLEKARDAHGQERLTINCAGIGWAEKTAGRGKEGDLRVHNADAFQKVVGVNLVGSFLVASRSALGMLANDPDDNGERGAIVHTASVAAEDGQIGQAAYAASKGGIVGMTLPMARDLAREGIRVNTILPGFFETPIYDQLPPEVKQALQAHTVFPARFGRPEEYASLVIELARNAYINAESIRIDSGARMPPR